MPPAFIVTSADNASAGATIIRTIPQTREISYLIIGARITKKCTRALITAAASQISGGKATTPGLSDDVFNYFFLAIPSCANKNEYWSAYCLIRSLNAVPMPWPALEVVRSKTGLVDLFASSSRATIFRE